MKAYAMRYGLYFFAAACLLTAQPVLAQSTDIPLWAKETWLLNRLEIKAGTHNGLNLSTAKPMLRSLYVPIADSVRARLLAGQNEWQLSKVDEYNLNRLQANNSEYSRYSTADFAGWKSKKPFLGYFWPTKGNLIEVNEPDFYLSINPAINQQQSVENDFDRRVFVNAKGLVARGLIARKMAFHFYLTDNQEQGPLHFRQQVDSNMAVPGAGYWKLFKTDRGVDYFDARGSVGWNVGKYINMQFGYDQHFIGNGYRSLFLSNFAAPNLYLRFNTRIGKLNYTNLFTQLFPPQPIRSDRLYDRKYMSLHHLSYNVRPWLNVGLFESMVFGEMNNFKPHYLQPVILLNSLLGRDGGTNNANLGIDFKANLLRKLQLYGQYLFDNLDGTDGKTGSHWWGSRNGFQLGAKYVDALGVKNLDLQLEYNQVRPFTYSTADSLTAYNHYRQPLAHPLGANFREVVGMARWQPANRWYVQARMIYWQQGLDSNGANFGANPLYNNRLLADGGRRLRNDGFALLSGNAGQGLNGSLILSYELAENLFIDGQLQYRLFDTDKTARQTTTLLGVGIRWNMFRREYDF
jgi:hypothetical protein